MPCFRPLSGYQRRGGGFTLRVDESNGNKMQVPCGYCEGCRLDNSRQWAVRCMHEARMHEHNQFVTLTYNDKHLPAYGSLVPEHMTNFFKRLRKEVSEKIRYFYCGEYGSNYDRPHYHALIFGLDLPDRYPWEVRNGHTYYRSALMEKLWSKDGQPRGFVTVGDVSFESAAYVARYILKKAGKNHAGKVVRPESINLATGEIMLHPEYARASRGRGDNRGLGHSWYQRYGWTDCHANDEVVHDGKVFKPPRYYDKLLEETDREKYLELKERRKKNVKVETPSRLADREFCLAQRLNRLPRDLENAI